MNLIGKTIEHYQILVKVRETPTRVLYKAFNTKSQTNTALEVVKTGWLKPDELLSLINEQVHKNAELTHPNIATVTETGLSNGLIYIVYNFSPMRPLRRFYNRTFSWKDMARELASITHAIAYAHEKGVIHGALHPSSIVLDEKRNPILFDFGFERIIANFILAHAPGTWIHRWGFEYRAPECLYGQEPTALSDTYSIGIMFHEWLIGKIPLLDVTPLGTLKMRIESIKINFGKESALIPPVVQDLIRKCTSADPDYRYQSMQEVYIILARGALDMSITKKMVRKPLNIPVRRFKLGRSAIQRIGMGAVLTLFALIIFISRPFLVAMFPTPLPATLTPTNIIPTLTPILPTVTATPTQETIPTTTPTPTKIDFPVFQETPISSAIKQTINTGNINKMILLSRWGIGDINRLVPAPNGKFIAAASSIGIFIFDPQSLKLEKYIDTHSWITALEFSPDSQTLVTGDSGGLIQRWRTDTWTESGVPYSGHTDAILDLAFSHDGAKFASISLDNTLLEWSVASTTSQKPLHAELIGGATAVAYSADNKHIVTGGNDQLIFIWDADTLTILQKTTFPSNKIVDIASLKDPNLFVVGGSERQVSLLDIRDKATLTTVDRLLYYPLTGVAASPDGKLIAAGDLIGEISIWDITDKTGDLKFKSPKIIKNDTPPATESQGDPSAPGSPHSLAFSPDGTLIFSGLHNGTIRSLKVSTSELTQKNQLLNAHVQKMVVSHNGQYLLTQQNNNILTIWDLSNGNPVRQLPGIIKPGDPFAQDDSTFVVASTSGPASILVYNPATGQELKNLASYSDLKSIQYTKNDKQLVTVYDKSAVHIWSTTSWQELDKGNISPHYGEVEGWVTYYDNKINSPLVSVTTDYQYVVADDNNRPGLCIFKPSNWETAFNESHGLIVYGGNHTLEIIDATNDKPERRPLQNVDQKNIVSIGISRDGSLIAAAYDDHTIHIWDAITRNELTVLSGLYGHTDEVTGLEFTPDDKLLITTSLDGTIRIWGVPY